MVFAAGGAEIDLTVAPNRNWEFTFAGTYLKPEFDSFVGGPAVQNLPTDPPTADLTGTRPPGISSITLGIAGTYKWTVGSYDAYLRTDFHSESNQRAGHRERAQQRRFA